MPARSVPATDTTEEAPVVSKKRRTSLPGVRKFLDTPSGPAIVRWDEPGDTVTGRVMGSRIMDTQIGAAMKKLADGRVKQHLQLRLLLDDGNETMLDIMSENQKKALSDALEEAGIPDLAVGDELTMSYIGNDPVIREGLSPARAFEASVTPV